MHIGRAHVLPLEQQQQHAADARVILDLRRSDPVVIARASAPTGQSGSQLPTYNPVTDLIQRQSQLAASLTQAPPPPRRTQAETYGGTPPAKSIIDLRA